MFGPGEGFAALAVGQQPVYREGKYTHPSWREEFHRWPDERERLLRRVVNLARRGRDDVYVCPNLMRVRRRRGGDSVERWCIHADVDGSPFPQLWEMVHPLGGFLVGSGSPDSFHAYIPLSRNVTLAEHRVLCEALRDHLGGDDKISDNDVLRVPGTLNHKARVRTERGSPSKVMFATILPSERTDPEWLAGQLGVELPAAAAADDPETAEPPQGCSEPRVIDSIGSIPLAVQDAVDDVTDDRSADTMRIVAACYDSGLSLTQARQVVATREDLRGRLAARDNDDVQVCWDKIDLDRRGRVPARSPVPLRTALPTSARRPIERVDLGAVFGPQVVKREWVIEGLIPASGFVSFVGPSGVGKSLLALALAVQVALASGSFAGMPIPRARAVLFVDMENSEFDLRERLEALGIGPGDVERLGGLNYLLWPDLGDLDTADGARYLEQTLDEFGLEEGDMVVLDSVQRVIIGPENEADTMRSFYRHTGAMLKRRRLTMLRTDNTGKDAGRGARGSVAKRDDVDIEYQIGEKQGDLTLNATKARIHGIIDRRIGRARDADGHLLFTSTSSQAFEDSVEDLCRELDRLGLPDDAGEPTVSKAIEAAQAKGEWPDHFPRKMLREAVRRRKSRLAGESSASNGE